MVGSEVPPPPEIDYGQELIPGQDGQLYVHVERHDAGYARMSQDAGRLGRVLTGAPRALRLIAQTMGAKPVATVFVGLIAQQQREKLPEKVRQKAWQAGAKLGSV